MGDFDPQDAYRAFEQFIEDNGGEFLDLTLRKIRERGRIVRDPEHPDVLVLDIERHRSLPGASYTKGSPMSAYETYIQRITFDPVTKDFQEIGITVVDRHVDVDGVAQEQLELLPPTISLKSGSESIRVVRVHGYPAFRLETSSLSEAQEAVRQIFSEFRYDEILTGLGLSEVEGAQYVRTISEAVTNLAVEKVEELWDEAEED